MQTPLRQTPILLLAAILLLAGCHSRNGGGKHAAFNKRQRSLLELYQTADSIYYKEGRIDTAAFAQFIRSAIPYSAAHPHDTIAPEMLYRAGIGSMILAKAATTPEETAQWAKEALSIFRSFQETYPDHEQARMCYYQRGIVYDDILQDHRSAEEEFRDFIHLYPDDPLTPQLKQYLSLMGKSEKEIEQALNIR